DLLEGLYARVGIAPGAFIFEGFPPRFREFSLRAHRWIRGDWQIISWLLPPRSAGLSIIARYRLLDNLRRSLVAPAAVAALLIGSFGTISSWWWALLVALAVGSGSVVSAILRSLDALFSLKRRLMLRYRIETMLVECSVAAFKVLLSVIVLLHQAVLSVDAICRALWRMSVSGRGLLEWRTAGEVSATTKGSLAETAAHMKMSLLLPVFGLALCLLNGIIPPPDLLLIAFLWTVAPIVVTLTGVRTDGHRPLPEHDRLFLRKIAARTMWYFSDMAKPEFHGLVPDLLQEEPDSKRHSHGLGISPTNFGMYLTSLASAHALGLLTIAQFSQRAYRAIERAGRMERYRGHFLNWYEMERLIPLEPRYVSSVDSANLALALLTVRQTALAAIDAPVFAPALLSGLDAELAIIEDECAGVIERDLMKQVDRKLIGEITQAAVSARALLARMDRNVLAVDAAELVLTGVIHQIVRMRNALETLKIGGEPRHLERLLVCLRNLEAFVSDLRDAIDRSCAFARIPVVSATADDAELRKKTAQLRSIFQRIPTVRELADGTLRERITRIGISEAIDLSMLARPEKDRAHLWFREILSRLDSAERDARDIASRFSRVAAECRRYFDEMDFAFLYDEERGLFRGGYSVTRKELDEGVYDLLASEANSASIVGIARGDVPKKHWRYLGRKLVRSLRGDTLAVSWAGSLFEYLGTLLFFDIPSESFWGVSAQRAIAAHREFARKRGIPWGMGESACARFNAQQQYHYQAFGEQSIGLKRDLSQSTVVAPYTSALALAFSPAASVSNLRWLAQLGTLGVYGFYDAFDLTGPRSLRAEGGIPAKVYFAHHQGFIMASIGNALAENVLRRALVAEPVMESITQLFEEQMPETVPADPLALPPVTTAPQLSAFEVNDVRRRYVPMRPLRQRSQFLSNGTYHVRITSAGSGSSAYENIRLTHEPFDALGESAGSFIYLFDRSRKSLWSPSYMPTRTAGEHAKTSFGESVVIFEKTFEGIRSTLSLVVHPSETMEVRILELTNLRSVPATLTVGACSEIALAPAQDLHAHRNYQKLFIRSEAIPERNAILAHRKDPRDRSRMVVAAFAVVPDAPLAKVRLFRSREGFFGSPLQFDDPVAMRSDVREGQIPEYSLDPAAGFTGECVLAPGETRRIAFSTIAGSERKTVEQKLREYGAFRKLARVVESAEREAPRALSAIGVSAVQAEIFADLASAVEQRRNVSRPGHPSGVFSQAALWKCGISGELPIVLLRVSNASDLGAVRVVLLAASYFLAKGIAVDVVILNDHPGGYLKTFEDEVDFLVRTAGLHPGMSGGVTHVRSDQLEPAERMALIASASVSIDSKRGTLADQVRSILLERRNALPPALVPTHPRRAPSRAIVPHPEPSALALSSALGGWDETDRSYVIRVGPGRRPPTPWTNVLSGKTSGALVNDRGAAFTWVENSHENKLTVAYTDPASPETSQAFFVRDDETGEYWSPQPIAGNPKAEYEVRHGFGVSAFRSTQGDLRMSLEMTVHPDAPLAFTSLLIENTGDDPRTLSVFGYFEMLLGKTHSDTRPHFSFERVSDSALSVTPLFHAARPTDVACVGVVSGMDAFTTSKEEFVGRFRGIRECAALERTSLSGSLVPDAEPCAAFMKSVVVPPGETRTVTFFVGMALPNYPLSSLLVLIDREHISAEAIHAQRAQWNSVLSSVRVRLPSPSTALLASD
ncbi:MAG TPA: glucoamylase family protein, partial [Candidatus Paceibacterota bacterium]|nr:glucoamylase family protein [Candidatus Paceibacterota bacterium]